MAVVMSGQFSFWLNLYAKVDKAMDLASSDLSVPVVRSALDRGGYALDEWLAGPAGKPIFVEQDRTDANSPTFGILDHRYMTADSAHIATNNRSRYRVDSEGRVLYQPKSITNPPASWFDGNYTSATGGGTINIANDSFVWHPNPAELSRVIEDGDADGRFDVDEDLNGNGILDTNLNEDVNNNGILDPGEDLNGNGILDPNLSEDLDQDGNLDVLETDANGNGVPDAVLLDRFETFYFGRAFYLDTVYPNPNPDGTGFEIGGRVYVVADNAARIFINGTFVGSADSQVTNGMSGHLAVTEILVPSEVLRPGQNVLTVEASNTGTGTYAGNPAGLAVVAQLGGVRGLGDGAGGVTLTTRPVEQNRWSVSRRSPNGFVGSLEFENRDGGSMAFRADNINRLQAVMGTLSSLLASSNEQDHTKFQAIR